MRLVERVCKGFGGRGDGRFGCTDGVGDGAGAWCCAAIYTVVDSSAGGVRWLFMGAQPVGSGLYVLSLYRFHHNCDCLWFGSELLRFFFYFKFLPEEDMEC